MKGMHTSDRDMERLAGEIRKLGVPFSTPEPDDRYWTNFRVRVMERVAERQPVSLLTRAGNWFAEHLLASGLTSAAAAVVIAFALLHESPATVQPTLAPPVASNVQPAAPPAQRQVITPEPVAPRASVAAEHHALAHHESMKEAAHPKLELAVAEEMADPGPVSLEDLSSPELESVLSGLTSSK